MNIQAYITSGTLELYVHGLASPEEIKEVEELASKHPEIQQEIEAIEQTLEAYALSHTVPPPAGLKEKILQNAGSAPKPKAKTNASKSGAGPVASGPGDSNWAAAAIGLLSLALIGACVAAFLFFKQADNSRQKAAETKAQFEKAVRDCEEQLKQQQIIQDQFIAIRHWATKPVQMKGTQLSETSYAIVYWNEVKRNAYLDVVALPEAPSGKQYQLWAIVNGKPTDMGVFDLTAPNGGLLSVPFIENAQAYAVTLEPKGGSPSPTLDQMYVIGKVSGS